MTFPNVLINELTIGYSEFSRMSLSYSVSLINNLVKGVADMMPKYAQTQ